MDTVYIHVQASAGASGDLCMGTMIDVCFEIGMQWVLIVG